MDSEGYATEANGGTLFLDEIGDMASSTQAKLLRLLQDGSYKALGDPYERHTDIRVIAATNKNLEVAVEQGAFREDLYYRLRILEVNLPPLRFPGHSAAVKLSQPVSRPAGNRGRLFQPHQPEPAQHYPWPQCARVPTHGAPHIS
jgi:transcriptional regulator with GAF, ATPase, and Fis domain